MTVRIGCGLSTVADARVAAIEAGTDARQALGGRRADLAVVFSSGDHLSAAEATLEGVHEALSPHALVGCGAGGVLGTGRELERGTAVTVWAAAFDGGTVSTFHAGTHAADGGVALHGMPEPGASSTVILLPDPLSFPTERALEALARSAPGTAVLGGLSSGRTIHGRAALFVDDAVVGDGAVGMVLDGIDLLPCVSQGAAAIGPPLRITAAEGQLLQEIDGRPALAALKAAIEGLEPAERALIGGGLLLGVAAESPGPPEYLIRGLGAADPRRGTVTVGGPLWPGGTVQLHVRDAAAADRDLREGLRLRREALGADPAGALVFTCNARGRDMFGTADHDADTVDELLDGAPAAGFFAAGEIGPVGGENHLHGFTATIAVFAA